jgi:glucose-1-phosphate thymidylyltransferase
MKAIITAGGRGTRLRPITHTFNKHLIPIANKPIIEYAIDSLKDAGIVDIGITYNEGSGSQGLDELKSYLGSGEKFGVKLTYIKQEAPIGLADCIRVSKDFIKDDKFVFYLGDNMLASGIKKFKEDFEKDSESSCYLLLSKVKDPQRFGVPVFDKNKKLIKIEEKPENPQTDLAVCGIYFYSPEVFRAFEGKDQIKPSKRGELEVSDLHQYLLDHDYKIKTYDVSGWWKDTGNLTDLLLANRLILSTHTKHGVNKNKSNVINSTLEGEVEIDDGVVIENSLIRGPVVIGKNTKIKNSYIGPFTSIDKNCVISQSEVENSIILDNTTILNVDYRIDSSLIGKDVKVIKKDTRPKTISLMIGDHSEIRLV